MAKVVKNATNVTPSKPVIAKMSLKQVLPTSSGKNVPGGRLPAKQAK